MGNSLARSAKTAESHESEWEQRLMWTNPEGRRATRLSLRLGPSEVLGAATKAHNPDEKSLKGWDQTRSEGHLSSVGAKFPSRDDGRAREESAGLVGR